MKATSKTWSEYSRRERGVVVSEAHFCILWEVDEQTKTPQGIEMRTRTELGAPLYRLAPENAHLAPLFDVAAVAVRALTQEALAKEEEQAKRRKKR